MKPTAYFHWDLVNLSDAMQISPGWAQEYFRDGRRGGFLLEVRAEKEFHWRRAAREGSGYDLIDRCGHRWEVRAITKHGAYFCSSSNVGGGRCFNEDDFLQKIGRLEGYVLGDMSQFPYVNYWRIRQNVVLSWYRNEMLSRSASASYKKMIRLLNDL